MWSHYTHQPTNHWHWVTNQPTTGTEPPTHQPATCPASFANFSLQRSSNIWANALLGAPSGWFGATVVGGCLVVGWRLFLLLALVVLLLAVNAVLCCRWVPGLVTGPTIVNSEPPRLPFQMLHCFCVPVWFFISGKDQGALFTICVQASGMILHIRYPLVDEPMENISWWRILEFPNKMGWKSILKGTWKYIKR